MSPSVLELMTNRWREGSNKGTRTDHAHLALVIEGGGMRGVYVAGMLLALERAGMLSVFDSIHGSSVGAHLGTYFATGEAMVGRDIFLNQALDPHFISPIRALSGGPVMDVDWMVDTVFAGVCRMKLERLGPDVASMSVVCTDAGSGNGVRFDATLPPKDYFQCLKATAKIPFLAGAPTSFRGLTLTDGGIAEQIPLPSARAAGATHALVLTTGRRSRKRKSIQAPWHRVERSVIRAIFGPALAAAYDARRVAINNTLDLLETDGPVDLALQAVYVPEDAPVIKRLTKDRSELSAAAEATEAATRALLL